jgi:hypothetical protein
MNYRVRIEETCVCTYEIEADNKQAACEQAEAQYLEDLVFTNQDRLPKDFYVPERDVWAIEITEAQPPRPHHR